MEKLTITFTTFLKLCAATPRGKLGELRKFLKPGGYDFYKVMKKLAGRRARGEIDLAEAQHQISKVKKDAERKHTLEAIKKLDAWLAEQDLAWQAPPRGAFKSASGLVTVRLEPELAFTKRGPATSVLYLWNLDRPDLKNELAGEGLRLLVRELDHDEHRYQFGIFNLRTKRILTEELIGAASDMQLKLDLMILETIWEDIHDSALSSDDVISHISSLKLPPSPPPPTPPL